MASLELLHFLGVLDAALMLDSWVYHLKGNLYHLQLTNQLCPYFEEKDLASVIHTQIPQSWILIMYSSVVALVYNASSKLISDTF